MLPFILEKVKIPEPVMLFIVLYIECSSMTVSAFVPELWQFHLSYSVLGMLNFCKYSLTMSMISKVGYGNRKYFVIILINIKKLDYLFFVSLALAFFIFFPNSVWIRTRLQEHFPLWESCQH